MLDRIQTKKKLGENLRVFRATSRNKTKYWAIIWVGKTAELIIKQRATKKLQIEKVQMEAQKQMVMTEFGFKLQRIKQAYIEV